MPRRHGDELTQRRAKRGADLDDRSFAPDGGAGADRQRRGQRFDQGDDRADHAFLVVDRIHHLRHAVAPRLGGKVDDQEGDDETAYDWHQNDEWAPWARRRKDAGVVSEAEEPVEGDVMEQADQGAKDHGAKAGSHADDDGKQRQPE